MRIGVKDTLPLPCGCRAWCIKTLDANGEAVPGVVLVDTDRGEYRQDRLAVDLEFRYRYVQSTDAERSAMEPERFKTMTGKLRLVCQHGGVVE